MPTNKRYENITITDFAAEGKCIYKSEDGVIFIQGHVAPGDVVDIEVVRRKKKMGEAIVTKFHSFSELRAEPFCQHFDVCGGCRWQHIDYSEQLNFKQKQVRDHFERIGKIKEVEYEPIVAAEIQRYYRNKLEYTFSNYRWLTTDDMNSGEEFSRNALGYHVPKRFDRIFQVEKCHLQPDPSNAIRNALYHFSEKKGYVFYNIKTNEGMMRNVIIRTSNTGDVLVIVQFAEPQEEVIEEVMQFLKTEFPNITSLHYIINQKGNDSYQDQDVHHYFGDQYIRETMEGLTFLVGPKSFYQTNSQQAYELYKIARNYAELTGSETVFDLYTGTGTIANFVARNAKKVIGVEFVEEAVADARKNSDLNGIHNTKFFAGDMKKVLNADFIAKHGKPDVIITDPPRAGMDPSVIGTILTAEPDRIVYVSCNTATQARDLELLSNKYKVVKAQPVDMFPHTHHVENVALLVKRQ
ncbi:23S rRNA (uracil(1939)-C(5))-methyltransferase RlmD [Persicitalea jodogahamensis]|uniref:23S rRNA (Uracil-5-)-methyltransferase RumA n=1 Tax=Persicitalea jodogahamensis TaxID=402147 RepID=A0A8J3GC53_9BACT|nr:23S rRNA (uracil(1939)-C(5))-methyltransferase RlmD [Persicitalea jodogahamensis]GHB82076.1 23S rRNA (uracil-5-)-methyltransferase RumA [Persicitalea jodogahamensis]